MCSLRFTVSMHYRQEVEKQLKTAQRSSELRGTNYCLAMLAVMHGQPFEQFAQTLRVHLKTVTEWVRLVCCYGVKGAPYQKPSGRPPRLTATQKVEFARLLDDGPVKAGFTGACWLAADSTTDF